MNNHSKLIISGAGLVGSTLAIALTQKGFQVDLIEKRSDMRLDTADQGRSINLVATSRGLNVFKNLGILEDVLKISVPVFGRMMHDRKGNLTYQAYGKETECNYSVSRGELNKLLLTKAEEHGVTIKFNSPIESLDYEKKELIFSNGVTQSYDHLFACDGAGSPIRRATPINYTVEELESDYKELSMPFKVKDQYPIDKDSLHIWPRRTHMLMALANLDGSFTMTLYMPKVHSEHHDLDTPSFDKIQSEEEIKNLFKKDFEDTIELMPEYLKEFNENPQGRLATVRSESWYYQDQVVLLGDAAHAIVPFFGQGMNCGLEDITYLLQGLEKYPSDWGKVFKYYDENQRKNGYAIADMALENYIEMRDKVADPHFLLKKQISAKIENSWPELYRSRYGMVTYTLIPYALAQKAGLIQEEILEELAKNLDSIESLDLKQAKKLIDEKFTPFIKEHNIGLKRFNI